MIPRNIADLVTFVPNKTEPIHNWFYYKEGFSKKLVEWLVKEYGLSEPVFDPFCGVGTTLLSCKQMGINAIGMDVSPLAVLASRVKTRDYDVDGLQSFFDALFGLKPEPIEKIPVDPRIRKLFYHNALETIWFYKNEIEQNKDTFPKPNFPVSETFFRKAKRMIGDVKFEKVPGAEPEVIQGDCRFDRLKPKSVGAIIASPPYLNKIEYTKIYGIELALFFVFQQKGL